jgi:hypothetical protein
MPVPDPSSRWPSSCNHDGLRVKPGMTGSLPCKPRLLRRGQGKLSESDIFLSGKPRPLGRGASLKQKMRGLANCDTVCFAGMTVHFAENSPPLQLNMMFQFYIELIAYSGQQSTGCCPNIFEQQPVNKWQLPDAIPPSN